MTARNHATRDSERSDEVTLLQARALDLVARTGSYQAAAVELGHHDATAVYKLIGRLQDSLGIGPLVSGARRGRVTLRPEGERVLVHARALLDAHHALRGLGQTIRVSCYPAHAARAAPAVLAFAVDVTRHPFEVVFHDVSDRLRADGGALLVERTASGEIDVAVAPSDRTGKGIAKTPLYSWHLRCVVHEDDPWYDRSGVSVSEFGDRRLLLAPSGHRSRELFERAAGGAQLRASIAMEVRDQHVLAAIARAGRAYTAVLPDDAFGPPSLADGPLLLDRDGEPIGDSYSLFFAERHREEADAGNRRSAAVLDLVAAIHTALADDLPVELLARLRGDRRAAPGDVHEMAD